MRLRCLYPLMFLPVFMMLAFTAAPDEKHVIEIRPTKFIATIAIPDFREKTGTYLIKSGTFSGIIYRDLELSGLFRRPDNEKFVAETNRSDEKQGEINFPEWSRLGCLFLLKGGYSISDAGLAADCYLYDIKTGQRIFGKHFSGYSKRDYRLLAHRISDEIVRYIAHEPGIASTRIIFVSRHGKDKEIYVMDADGFGKRALTADGSLAATPCWGAAASEIYYTSYKDYNPDLCGMRISDGKTWFISRHPGFNLSPTWCEKTKCIALTLSKDGNSEIYTMDRTGRHLKRLTFNRAIDSSPSWSPEGNQILFTSDRSGSPQIYAMDSEGLNVRRLTFQGTYNDSAVWSPNGDKIAFVTRQGGAFNIFLMNIDGTNWVQLTANQGNNEDPSWAPDSHHIVFTSDRTGSPQIYVMNDNGSNQAQLTFTGSSQSAAWSPLVK